MYASRLYIPMLHEPTLSNRWIMMGSLKKRKPRIIDALLEADVEPICINLLLAIHCHFAYPFIVVIVEKCFPEVWRYHTTIPKNFKVCGTNHSVMSWTGVYTFDDFKWLWSSKTYYFALQVKFVIVILSFLKIRIIYCTLRDYLTR